MSARKLANLTIAGRPRVTTRTMTRMVRKPYSTAERMLLRSSIFLRREYLLYGIWSQEWESNPRPKLYESLALPTELSWRMS